MDTTYQVLKGVKVIELGIFASGPMAARLLGEMGAEVIKIEEPKGDPCHTIGANLVLPCGSEDEDPCILLENASKRDIVLNLKIEEGKAVLFDQLKDANIFITNIRYDGLKRMGLSYEDLKEDGFIPFCAFRRKEWSYIWTTFPNNIRQS